MCTHFVRDFSLKNEPSDDKKEHKEKTHKKQSLVRSDQRPSLAQEIVNKREERQKTKKAGSFLEKKVKRDSKKMSNNEAVPKSLEENIISPPSNMGSNGGNQSTICAGLPLNGSLSGALTHPTSGGIILNVGYEDLHE